MAAGVARSAGVISLATLTSRLLGVVRETVLAFYFGASASMQMDAFTVAFRVPNLLRDLFAEGAMTAAFVPAFTRTLVLEGRERAWRLGTRVLNALLLMTGVVVLLGMLGAGPITALVAREFAAVPGKLELTVDLTRVMMPFVTMVAAAVAMMGMLHSLGRVFVPSLAPAMFNVATILSVVALVPLMPHLGQAPIMAVAVGTLIGGLGQVAVQWPLLRRAGFEYRPLLGFRDPDLRRILLLMVPGTLGVAAVNINVLVNTFLATGQEQGAVSWLGYAYRIIYLPLGLIGVSVATAALPVIARQAAGGDLAAIRQTVSTSLRMMLMLNVPATVGLVILAEPIVAMLYERGLFSHADTAATAAAVMFYAPGLVGYSAVKIASPTFYALDDSRTPVLASTAAVAANLGINLALIDVMGFRGLALGTALSALANAGVLLWLLRRRLGGLDGARLATGFVKIAAASGVMGGVATVVSGWLGQLEDGGELIKIVRVFGTIAAALAALALAARVLHIDEFNEALRVLGRRLRPAPADVER